MESLTSIFKSIKIYIEFLQLFIKILKHCKDAGDLEYFVVLHFLTQCFAWFNVYQIELFFSKLLKTELHEGC